MQSETGDARLGRFGAGNAQAKVVEDLLCTSRLPRRWVAGDDDQLPRRRRDEWISHVGSSTSMTDPGQALTGIFRRGLDLHPNLLHPSQRAAPHVLEKP